MQFRTPLRALNMCSVIYNRNTSSDEEGIRTHTCHYALNDLLAPLDEIHSYIFIEFSYKETKLLKTNGTSVTGSSLSSVDLSHSLHSAVCDCS